MRDAIIAVSIVVDQSFKPGNPRDQIDWMGLSEVCTGMEIGQKNRSWRRGRFCKEMWSRQAWDSRSRN